MPLADIKHVGSVDDGQRLYSFLSVGHNEDGTISGLAGSPNLIPAPAESSVVTMFQSGHGFTASPGATGSQSDDTADFLYGTQSRLLTTAGTNGFTACRKTGMGAIDATGKCLAMTVKIDRPDRLADCRLDISSDVFTNWSSGDTISPSTNTTSPFYVPNEWITVTFQFGAFAVGGGAGATRSALTAFQVRCKDDGSGVINMRVNKISLFPEPANGVISFVFDDGYSGVWTKAKPILDGFNYKACFAPIINKIGATNFMTLSQLYGLRDAGWEAQAHSYDVDIHTNYAAVTDAQAITDMNEARTWLRDNGFGLVDNIVVPQGQTTSTTRIEAWKKMAGTARTAYSRVRETYPPGKPHLLRTYTLSQANNTADIQAKIDECKNNKTWLIFQAHNVVDASPVQTDYLTADFQTIVNYVNSQGVKVKTVADVLRNGVT